VFRSLFLRAVPYTNGFETTAKLVDHYGRHHVRLHITTMVEYERRADEFCGGPRRFGTFQCQRKIGDRLRYNILTKEFGILTSAGRILTYYIPDRARHKKLFHFFYFIAECRRPY